MPGHDERAILAVSRVTLLSILSSSPRTRGPITTGVFYCKYSLPHCSNDRTRRMGPCFRRDDIDVIERSNATKQSTLISLWRYGLLRGACHRARVRATRWLAMTDGAAPARHPKTDVKSCRA